MRVMMKVTIPAEAGNAAVRSGTLGSTIKGILEELHPEAVYFTDYDGQRTGFMFLDMKDNNDVIRAAEPWFLAFDADVEIKLVMSPEDLMKGEPYLKAAAQKYG
jgi:hypothetical protein